MIQKISAVILVISLVLGVSANSAAYAQVITPSQPQIAPQLQQGGQPITFQEDQPPLATTNQGQPASQQQLPPPQQQQPQNLQSTLLQNTPEGINQANNLANFNLSVQDKQSLAEFFNKCPSGIILYKVNGQFFVYCFTSPFGGELFGLHGQQTVNIDVKVVTKHSGGNNGGKKSNDRDNNDGPDGDCLFNASLPKCDPDEDGNCPDGFNLNEDGNCFPNHHEEGCPDGYHGVDDDETGQCYDNDEGCPVGMTFREDGKSCGYTDELCGEGNENPNCEEEEPVTCGSGFVLENDACVALDSNCGGVPCTATEKEDSTTSDPVLGEPLPPITDPGTDEVPSDEVPSEDEEVPSEGDGSDGSSNDGSDSSDGGDASDAVSEGDGSDSSDDSDGGDTDGGGDEGSEGGDDGGDSGGEGNN